MTTRTCSLVEAIASVPLTLGYHPTASLVVVLRHHDAVAMTLRLDDDAVGAQPQACLDAVIRAADAVPHVTSCDLVAYRSMPGLIDLDTLTKFFGRALRVQHAVRVDEDRWWVELCAVATCTASAHRSPESSASLFLSPPATAASEIPASRDDACAPLRSSCPELSRAVQTAMGEKFGAPVAVCDVRTAWSLVVEAGAEGARDLSRPVIEALATVLMCLTDGEVRDEMTAAIVPALHDGGGRPWSAPPPSRAFLDLLRAVPEGERAEWLAFVALARWREGDRPGAVLAAQEANAHHVRCGLVPLVLEVVSSGMPHTFLMQRRPSGVAVTR